MKKNVLKRLLAVLTASILLVSALAGCGNSASDTTAEGSASAGAATPAANSDDTYYMISFLSTLEFWDDCWNGMQDAAKIYGANVEYTGAQEADVNEEITVLEQVMAKNPAGIAITCTDAEGLQPTIDKAIAQGIEVVCFDSDSSGSSRYSHLGTGNENAGKMLGEYVFDNNSGDLKAAVMLTVGVPTHEARAQGVKDAVEEYSNVSLVSEANFDGEQDDAAKQAASIIQANPDINVIFAVNSAGALGAAAAVREAGKEGDILICGFDTDVSVYEGIEAGSIYCTARQGAYNMGFWSMQFLYCVRNDLLNPVDGWRENGLSPLPPEVDTGVDIVNADNLSAFYSA